MSYLLTCLLCGAPTGRDLCPACVELVKSDDPEAAQRLDLARSVSREMGVAAVVGLPLDDPITRPQPCPFCDCREVEVAKHPNNMPLAYGVQCPNCYALGPLAIDRLRATLKWNRAFRPAPAVVDASDQALERVE